MSLITTKSDRINAINDLGKQDDVTLHTQSKFLMEEVEKELIELKSSEHGMKDAIRKMGKAVGATTKEERVQESLVHLGAIRLSTFIALNPLALNLPEDIKKTADDTLSSLTYPPNIKHLQENLRSIFEIKE